MLTPARIRQLWYVPILVVSLALMMMRSLVMASLLDLPEFATFSGGLLVSSMVGMLACLGLQPFLQRQLPIQFVRRRETAGLVLLAQSILAAIGCTIIGLLLPAAGVSLAGLTPLQLVVALLHGLSQQVFLVASIESRSRGDPLRYALQNFWRAIAILGAGVLCALMTESAITVLAAELVLTLVLSQAILRNAFARVGLGSIAAYRLAWRTFGRVPLRSCGALLGVWVIGYVLINLDRWTAAETLAAPEFARYAFAWIVLTLAQASQTVVNASIFPMLARRFATSGSRSAFRASASISITMLFLGLLLAWPAVQMAEIIIQRWFAPYAAATSLLPIFIVIAVFRLSDFWSNFLVIVGWEKHLLKVNVLVGSTVVVAWLAWSARHGAAPGMHDIAWLGAALAASGYLAASLMAWRARGAMST